MALADRLPPDDQAVAYEEMCKEEVLEVAREADIEGWRVSPRMSSPHAPHSLQNL
jgi:hypothetical protein